MGFSDQDGFGPVIPTPNAGALTEHLGFRVQGPALFLSVSEYVYTRINSKPHMI